MFQTRDSITLDGSCRGAPWFRPFCALCLLGECFLRWVQGTNTGASLGEARGPLSCDFPRLLVWSVVNCLKSTGLWSFGCASEQCRTPSVFTCPPVAGADKAIPLSTSRPSAFRLRVASSAADLLLPSGGGLQTTASRFRPDPQCSSCRSTFNLTGRTFSARARTFLARFIRGHLFSRTH